MNELMPFAETWMDLEIITLNEVNHMEKDKYPDITYLRNLKKMIQMNLFMKQTNGRRKQAYSY